MKAKLMQELHFVNALPPVADVFNGTKRSSAVNIKNYNACLFFLQIGVGTTGTSTITIAACSASDGSNRTAIPFKYREILSGDTETPVLAADAAGFTTTAGSNKLIAIEVDPADVTAANNDAGYTWVELTAVESVNDPVLGGIAAILGEARYAGGIKPSALS